MSLRPSGSPLSKYSRLPSCDNVERCSTPGVFTASPRLRGADHEPVGHHGSFWAHPERVLDANERAATSGFARMPTNVVDRVVSEVARDLANGRWDDRHGHLRSLDALDVGLRLVVATG